MPRVHTHIDLPVLLLYDSDHTCSESYAQEAKRLLERQAVLTPRWRLYDRIETDDWDCFPAIVRSSHEHASLELTRDAVVLTREALSERVAYVLDMFHQPALVEDLIDGREFHVTVWADHSLRVLPPAEMDYGAFSDVRDRLWL